MVTGHDHQRPQNDLLITGRLDLLDDLVTGGLLRLTLYGADKDVVVTQLIHLCLHLTVGDLGDMSSAVTHENKGSPVLCGSSDRGSGIFTFITGFRGSSGCDSPGNSCLVFIDDRSILTDLAQQGLCHTDGLKITLHSLQGSHQLIMLRPMHEMSGLYDKVFHAVCLRAGQCLVDIVDHFLVSGLHMVDDDLGCKCPADGPVRICFLECLFDTADVLNTAFIERGAEAHDQELVLADLISIAGIIQGRVARVAAEVIGIRVLAFHQSLLLIGQGVPGIAGGLDVRVRCLCAFLYIDRVDQRSSLRHRVSLHCRFRR